MSAVIPPPIPIVTLSIKKPTIAARPATPSPSDNPTATPTANNNAKFENIILPASDIIVAINWNQPAFNAGTKLKNWGSWNIDPNPSNKPAAGNKATGNIKALPILCKTPKAFFILISPFKWFLSL